MFKAGMIGGVAGMMGMVVLSSAGEAAASRDRHVNVMATIYEVEGTPPFGVTYGGGIDLSYVMDTQTADFDAAASRGIYIGGARRAFASLTSQFPYPALQAESIYIENNVSFRDTYRLHFYDEKAMITMDLELIDGNSEAFSSDRLPQTLSLEPFTDEPEVDFAIVSVQSTDPGAQWRVVARVDSIQTTSVFCRCDWNNSDTVNSQDFFDFLTGFFSGAADYNRSGSTDSQDFFDFLSCFFDPAAYCR